MVVVGKRGRLRDFSWAARRTGKGDLRLCISGVTASWRALTAGSLVRAEVARECMDLALASSSALTEAGKTFELHMYPDEDHGFFRPGANGDSPAIRDVRPKVEEFLHKHLG